MGREDVLEQPGYKQKGKIRPHKKKRSRGIWIAAVLLALALVMALLLGRELEKRTYRLDYPNTIAEYAKEYKLDPYLISSIIHCESGNRPDAVSPDGAVGLMQIMPTTGEWVAGKLQVEDFHTDMLFEPSVNIRFGCWYLQFLMDRYDQDRQLAVAAYNAGHGTVDKWLGNPEISAEGRLVEIPYPETKTYVEKVQRAYEKYEFLYKNAF